jgi:hypothetical protein
MAHLIVTISRGNIGRGSRLGLYRQSRRVRPSRKNAAVITDVPKLISMISDLEYANEAPTPANMGRHDSEAAH